VQEIRIRKNIERNLFISTNRRLIINVTGKIARKKSQSLFFLPYLAYLGQIDLTRARAPKTHPLFLLSPNCATYHSVPSHPTPSQKNRQKLPFASMLLLCQHSHYVSANSKSLLYLFRVYDILYFTFLIIFFCSLILDVPCLYHQPTAKLLIPHFRFFLTFFLSLSLSLSLFHPANLFSFNPLARAALSPLAGYFLLSSLSFSLSLSLSQFINSIVLISSSFVCYNIIIGNNIPSLLMQYHYY